MTVTGEGPRPRDPQEAPATTAGRSPRDAVHRVCPYLVAADGGWRSVHPTKDHRCGATQPAAALALVKQRDLCLRPGYAACATYVAARDLEAESAPPVPAGVDGFWPSTRATVLALEPARARSAGFTGRHARTGGQAALVGLIVVAFLVLVVARTTPSASDGAPGASIGGGASTSAIVAAPVAPGPAGSGAASTNSAASPTASAPPATPVPSATPGPTAAATVRPTPSTPGGSRSYTVKSGDTLSGIAGAFGVTVKQLRRANGLTSTVIHRGQVLVIPAP